MGIVRERNNYYEKKENYIYVKLQVKCMEK